MPVVRHLGSGKYSDVFKVQPALGAKAVVMKVSYYRNDTFCNMIDKVRKGDVGGATATKKRDAVAVGNRFARITSALVDSVSPHFVIVFCSKDCRDFASRLGPLLRNRLKELSPLQKKFNNVCFMELFHGTMTRFLLRSRADDATVRGLVFQIVYTLAALQKKFPGFRHNDLSTNNVLLKKLRTTHVLAYRVGRRTFHVPTALFPALSDYDFVHAPGPALQNERVLSGKYKVDGRPNDSYDTHFFLKSVFKCLEKKLDAFPHTKAFLARLALKEDDRQNSRVIARLRPSTLLRDPYFAPLVAKPAGGAPVAGVPSATYSF